MRIGLVVAGGVDRSGRERVVPVLLSLVERLAKRHELHVFVLNYYPEPCTYRLLGATVHDVGRVTAPPGLRRVRIRARLAAVVETELPLDVLHAYQGMPPGLVTAQVAARLGVPVIVTFSSGELVAIDDIRYGLQRRWLDRRAVQYTIRAAARLTVDTGFMAHLASSHGARADVVPVGVDAGKFPLAAREDGPPWRLIRVGSLNAVKDHGTLLHALAQVLQRIPDVFLDIVGEDTLSGSTQALCRSLGFDGHVAFHGFQPTDRLAALYARAHLHVVSSRHEASSVAMLEAASTGLATVGTAVGYVSDWAPDRAVAVPVQDPGALASAIVDLLQDRPRRERIASAARAWTLAHDADWTARQFERLYDEVRAESRQGAQR